MQSVRASRPEPIERAPVSPRSSITSIEDMNVAALPQVGSSPAIDLQRRLGEAALRGFYTIEPIHQGVQRKNYALAGAVAVLAWGVVFGIGMAVIG